MLDEIVKENGFTDLTEFNELVAKVELSTTSQMEKFKTWQQEDGTKEGLLKLLNEAKKEHIGKPALFEDFFYQKFK